MGGLWPGRAVVRRAARRARTDDPPRISGPGARAMYDHVGNRRHDCSHPSCARAQVALELLDLGFDVLLLDPDLALLRNPLPYFETLPACDMFVSIDSNSEPTMSHVVQNGGFAVPGGVEGVNFNNFFNTGVIMFRTSPRVRAWVRAYVAHAAGEYTRGSNIEDQGLFNRYLHSAHVLRFGEVGYTSPGQYVFDAVMSNRCIRCVSASCGRG